MQHYPSPTQISSIFTEEVTLLGGTVTDQLNTGKNLFLRALVPVGGRAQPRDFIGHGVALRTRGDSMIVVHPYTFREVCSNGAIHVTNVSSQTLERTETPIASRFVSARLRDAIKGCAMRDAFEENISDMQSMLSQEVRMPLAMSAILRHLKSSSLVAAIMDRYLDGGDQSLFGLMNAVTSQARDESSPSLRWRLEELGGGILAVLKPRQPVLTPGREVAFPSRKDYPQTAETP